MDAFLNFIFSFTLIDVLSFEALLFSLSGNLLINYKRKSGFIIWIISNILWIVVNLLGKPNISQIIMFIVYMCFNVQGFINWKKK